MEPTKDQSNHEVFLSQLENGIFKMPFDNLKQINISKEELQAIIALGDGQTIVIKRTDKRSYVVMWNRMDYFLEDEKQLSDTNICKSVNFRQT